MMRLTQDWPPGGPVMANSILRRAVAFSRSLETQDRRTFSRHFDAAASALSAGSNLEAAGRLAMAIGDAQNRFGPNHPLIASMLVVSGDIDVRRNAASDAEANLRRAVSILEGLAGYEHLLAYAHACLGILYRNQGIDGEAQRHLLKAQEYMLKQPATGS
jgi:tetratricopeptide (TPR) repeat protein